MPASGARIQGANRKARAVPVVQCRYLRIRQMKMPLFTKPFVVLLCACLFSAGVAIAAPPDFSGNYTLSVKKRANTSAYAVWEIHVIETPSSIEVTRSMGGQQLSNVYPLTGGPGRYVTLKGDVGTCEAKLKGNKLILDSFVSERLRPDLPMVQFHTRQQWELSKDMKTLKILTDVDFPRVLPLGIYLPIEPLAVYKRS
jgi:hypothetical protein